MDVLLQSLTQRILAADLGHITTRQSNGLLGIFLADNASQAVQDHAGLPTDVLVLFPWTSPHDSPSLYLPRSEVIATNDLFLSVDVTQPGNKTYTTTGHKRAKVFSGA